jgi:hypothetical protein
VYRVYLVIPVYQVILVLKVHKVIKATKVIKALLVYRVQLEHKELKGRRVLVAPKVRKGYKAEPRPEALTPFY